MSKLTKYSPVYQQPFIIVLTTLFIGFILWIIYLADTGQNSQFFNAIQSIPSGDKLGHFCLFGVLTLLVNLSCKLNKFRLFNVNIYNGSALVFIFVIFEELSQQFFSTRTMDAGDLLADIIGIVCFSWLAKLLQQTLTTLPK